APRDNLCTAWAQTCPVLRVLYRNCRLTSALPGMAAFLVQDGTIRWIGPDSADPGCDREFNLDGRLVTPAFVDAHVHSTANGLALDGLELRGLHSRTAVLDSVARYARQNPGAVILGSGWDESGWADKRPPTADELDIATDGAQVYLTRVDVHSALA